VPTRCVDTSVALVCGSLSLAVQAACVVRYDTLHAHDVQGDVAVMTDIPHVFITMWPGDLLLCGLWAEAFNLHISVEASMRRPVCEGQYAKLGQASHVRETGVDVRQPGCNSHQLLTC